MNRYTMNKWDMFLMKINWGWVAVSIFIAIVAKVLYWFWVQSSLDALYY